MSRRLADATSLYLRQHADNPVDWHPWGDEAFARARAEDRPLLVSIGYAACHWCHVMAHECFEDAEVAAAMNRDFVCVKVDREERPDVDRIYQTAHALMSRRGGGWPLTVFATPGGDPFYVGTYFPKHARHGLPGLLDLLPRVASVWRERREAIAAQGDELRRALASLEPSPDGAQPWPADAPRRLLDDLAAAFDAQHGGFGEAPKFPHVPDLALALRQGTLRGARAGTAIATLTARRMADGGIHDQVGGGFFRYATDARWAIPHFEKMLCDNAALLALYADLAATADGDDRAAFAGAAEGIVAWMARELRAPEGTFCSSLDADSEGEEGRYYVWQRDHVRALLRPEAYAVAAEHWGLHGAPNFEGRAWHLAVARPLAEVAASLAIGADDARRLLDEARAVLAAARSHRVPPARDDKILTAWNALAIAALARASRRLARPDWADLAFAALDAQKRHAWQDGRLLATRRDARAALNAYLDDYAFMLVALDEAMRTRFRRADYAWARELADAMLARFEDARDGGFWFTSHDHEALIHRGKPGHDEATPSGNGMAALGLAALGHLAGEPRYLDAARRVVQLFAGRLAASPSGFATLAVAVDELDAPPPTVLLVGDPAQTARWHAALARPARAEARVYDVGGLDLPAELRRGEHGGARAAAWVCEGLRCLDAVTTLPEIEALLAAVGRDAP